MTTQEIIDALTTNTGRFPRAALSEASQHREELIPRLLDVLDHVCDIADDTYKENPSGDIHFYAAYLLAQFREKQAFPRLIRLFRQNEDKLDFILGDAVTEGGSRFFCSVYDGNLGLLKELIEDTNAFDYARNAGLEAYGFITRNNPAAREEMIDYLRHFINGRLKDESSYMPTFVSSMIIQEHLFELIPDVKYLYDRDLIDHTFHGGYDDFINFIFSYSHDVDNIYIDDVVKELQNWHKYDEKPKPKPIPKPPAVKPVVKEKKKIGRNDPCPCGSGNKYKRCCLPLGIRFNNEEENEDPPEESYDSDIFDELRKFNGKAQPYDLMQDYPPRKPPAVEGQRTIIEFYSPKAIEIDIPVYKALCHRSIPIWVKRNNVNENLERIDFLLEAFTMFSQTCAEEGLETFDAFDRKYMVHYDSAHWVSALNDLLAEYADRLPAEKSSSRDAVNAALARYTNRSLQ